MSEGFFSIALPLISLALGLGSLVAAWHRRKVLAWAMLGLSWLIWPILFLIGQSDNSAHGTGLYYLDMFAMFVFPFATIGALMLTASIALILKRRALKAGREIFESETL